jgi:hypothetical protein
MKPEELYLDMKVVPFKKTLGCAFENSNVLKNMQSMDQEFAYITKIDGRKITLNEFNSSDGDYFDISYFTEYSETSENTKAVETIKQLPQHTPVQYSLNQQLHELHLAANKLGLYDAADFVNRILSINR